MLLLLDKACRKNWLGACKTLGVVNLEGLGTPIDFGRAELLLARACEGGDKEVCDAVKTTHALVEQHGATPTWEAGCAHGDAQACDMLLALRCKSEAGQSRSAPFCLELTRRECDHGDLEGCNDLGLLLAQGYVGPKDAPRAQQLFESSCDEGNARGCLNAGVLLASGAPPDPVRALPRLVQACEGKNAEGCRDEGILQRTGGHDPAARAAFEHGCTLKDVRACALLGTMLAGGEGGPKDLGRAMTLLDDACKAGDESACAVRSGLR